jgi:hypothetical protein
MMTDAEQAPLPAACARRKGATQVFKLTNNRTRIIVAILAVVVAAIAVWKGPTIVSSTTGAHSPIVSGNSGPVTIAK